jgi:hypothetical protein
MWRLFLVLLPAALGMCIKILIMCLMHLHLILGQVRLAKNDKEMMYCLSNQTSKDIAVAPIYNLGLLVSRF